jgi:hypothetical protein
MRDSAQQSNVLLTLDDVRQWVEDRETLKARLRDLDKKLDLAATLSQAAKDIIDGKGGAPEAKDEDRRDRSLVGFLANIIADAADGIALNELRAMATASEEFGEQTTRNSNAVYNAVTRLAARKEAIKVGSRIFSPDNYNILREAVGEGLDESLKREDERETFPTIVRRILTANPKGLTASELINNLKELPDFAPKVKRNPSYAYTALGRMMGREQVVREGKLYKLPP